MATLKELERDAIVRAIAEHGTQKDAAKALGISARVINYKMMRLNIPRPRTITSATNAGDKP